MRELQNRILDDLYNRPANGCTNYPLICPSARITDTDNLSDISSLGRERRAWRCIHYANEEAPFAEPFDTIIFRLVNFHTNCASYFCPALAHSRRAPK